MVDRLRIGGKSTITEDTSTGAVGGDFDSVDAERVFSPSVPPTIKIFHDGTDVVAVDDNGVVSRSTNATTVWAAAISQINASYDPTEKFEAVGTIDGNGDLYSIPSGFPVKEGCIVRNARFEGSNNPDSYTVTFGGPDDGAMHGAIGAYNVVVRDSQFKNIKIRDVSHGVFQNIVSENAGAGGITINSSIGCLFAKLHSRNSGGVGIDVGNSGFTTNNSNANTFVACRAQSNAGTGIRVGTSCDGNRFSDPISEANGTHGFSDASEENTWISIWSELNTNRGILLTGARSTVQSPTVFNNDGGGGGGQGIRVDGAEGSRIVGPIGGNDEIAVANGPDVRLDAVSDGKVFVDNAVRTRRNGLGEESANAETPTASSWDVGDVVNFTDSGDATGDGVYQLAHDGATWIQLA